MSSTDPPESDSLTPGEPTDVPQEGGQAETTATGFSEGSFAFAVEAYSGPYPHPDFLERYEALVPGAAERILTITEENAKAYRDLERDVFLAQENYAKELNRQTGRGQTFAFILTLAFLVSILIVVLFAEPKVAAPVGSALAGTTFAIVIVAFIARHGSKFLRRMKSEDSARSDEHN